MIGSITGPPAHGATGRERIHVASSDPRHHDKARGAAARALRHDEADADTLRRSGSGGRAGREHRPNWFVARSSCPGEVLVAALAQVCECDTGLQSAHVWDLRAGAAIGDDCARWERCRRALWDESA